jgi:NAD(P)-dependent dehydrogenase (short-subunit alcohol dehydrogenase family)
MQDTVTRAGQLFDLTGEVALVTGASSGLGRRFAKVLAAHGASVVLAARRRERLDRLAEEIAADGGRSHGVALDVTDRAGIAQAFDAAEQAFGTVTLLVNNAGISGTLKRGLELSADDWRALMAVNLDAVWFTTQEAARRMVSAGKPGAIVNIASILGFRVGANLAPYAVAKAGVVQMTCALALDLARYDIRVNAIAPGYIVTEMNEQFFSSPAGEAMRQRIPQRRTGDPSDLDGTLLLLASRRASGFMTGSTVVVDGGHMLSMG